MTLVEMNGKHVDEALVSRENLAHSDIDPLVIPADENMLERLRAIAKAKGKEPYILAKELIFKGLDEEEKLEQLLRPIPQATEVHKKETIDIYVDGGCRGNPGTGGWAAIMYEGPRPEEISGAEKHTTNNCMELRAAIEGLRSLGESSTVRLYSDSAYLIDSMNKGWLATWSKNGWKKADKKSVKNVDLWEEILKFSRFHKVEWIKVKGHAGNPANERCHELVQIAIERAR